MTGIIHMKMKQCIREARGTQRAYINIYIDRASKAEHHGNTSMHTSFCYYNTVIMLGLDSDGFFTFNFTVHRGTSDDGVEATCLHC